MPQDLTRRRSTGLLALALAATTAVASSAVSQTPASSYDALTRVLVTSTQGAAAAADAVRAAGGTVLRQLTLVSGVSAELPRDAVLAPTFQVLPNTPLSVAKAAGPAEGAPVTVRETVGLPAKPAGEGAGVTVAVVDTGVADVPGLAGRLTHVDVTDAGEGNADKSSGSADGYGHGTFVAGLVAGAGDAEGNYAGVAPAARVLDVRVADDQGRTDLLTVLAGLEQIDPSVVSVLNLSLSSGSELPYQIDPLSQALESLWRRGVTVVVPSGNDGPDAGTVTAPGTDPLLLTVGGLDESGTAATSDDVVAEFSGRGPAPQGVAKPDLVAPASHLISLRAPGSHVDRTNSKSRVGAGYFRGSGTSFSTAVVSGAAAVVLAQRPSAEPGQVKELFRSTAYAANGLRDANGAGKGGLSLATALNADLPASAPDATEAIPGDAAAWEAFVDALLQGDHKLAARNWAALSLEARNWAASSWSSLTPEGRNWAASSWSGRNWADADGTAMEWDARNWAARNWAARNWAGRNWSGRNWADSEWTARNWSARNWSARNWSARNWSARNWSARNWSARNWSGVWH